jgi:hypothetical protein
MNSQEHFAVDRKNRGNCTSPSKWFHERGRAWKESSRGTFVERDEFCKLLLSSRKVIRCDETTARGLLDVATGERLLIQQEKLFER